MMSDIDAEALKEHCPNCEAEHIHTSHGRCIGCLCRDTDGGPPDIDEIDRGPVSRPLEDGDPCPECGHPFDDDEWRIRKLPSGPTIGEDWVGYCPNCEQRTYKVGT